MAYVVRSTPRYVTSAQRRIALDASFRCDGCGFSAPVRVWADGTGHYTSLQHLHPEAAHFAATIAEQNARTLAQARHARLSCPSCGLRCEQDRNDVAKKRGRMIPLAILGAIVAIVGITAYVLDSSREPNVGSMYAGILGLFVIPTALLTRANASKAIRGASGANAFAQFAAPAAPMMQAPQGAYGQPQGAYAQPQGAAAPQAQGAYAQPQGYAQQPWAPPVRRA